MLPAMIGTWRMAFEGMLLGLQQLQAGAAAGAAIEEAIKVVEDYPYYKSVGYGGLPNEQGEVELDAAFMDGDTLAIGAVAGLRDYKNPIAIARQLSQRRFNSFLVGAGAAEYAAQQGFASTLMLSERAKTLWEKRLQAMREQQLSAYDGHDTVGMVALDGRGSMAAGTSTSGLFMKKRGRVGDSPLSGSGFYVDSAVGGATATGVGEDIMKGCLSYEIVRLMENGLTPQVACNQAVYGFSAKLAKREGRKAGAMSVVALRQDGAWGAATNVEFSFVVGAAHAAGQIYLAYPAEEETTRIVPADAAWLEAYEARIKQPV